MLRLGGLRFFTILGDLPHERENPQPLEVDLEVATDLRRPATTDRLADGIDYRTLYDAAAEVATSTEPHLLETLAARIADAVLALDGVDGVTVRCRKPWAALPGPVETIEVEIERP